MAAQKRNSGASKKKPAAGGGRTPNTEPRLQLFSKFAGCNFQMSPRDFVPDTMENDQSDLQMNYLMVQNNARVAPNATIETRQNIETLFTAPSGERFTGVCSLIGDLFYAATDKGNMRFGQIGTGAMPRTVIMVDHTGYGDLGEWTYIGQHADTFVGIKSGLLWTDRYPYEANMESNITLTNAKMVPNPIAIPFYNLKANGALSISETLDDAHPFRISIRHTELNKFGPTLPSPPLTFFANRPTTEWSGSAYLTIKGHAPKGDGDNDYMINAVELYYTEDEYQDYSFLAHINLEPNQFGFPVGGEWRYNWTGYLFDTSMWAIANLSLPKENYTTGVRVKYMTYIDGRMYFWGAGGANKSRLYIGGNPGNEFSVSTGVGGGFCDIEPGNGHEIRSVTKYKTQSGNSIVTVLCDNDNSTNESRFNLVENNITLSNEQSTKGWQAERVSNTVGCKSPRGAGVWGDGLYAVSRYGLSLTTMTMEYNSQLRVNYVSDQIEPAFVQELGIKLSGSVLICVNDVLYLCMGKENGELDNVLFCYDTNLKAWWTYTLDVDEPILNMIHIDHEGNKEGIGILTDRHVYLLPTTMLADHDVLPTFDVQLVSGELGTTQPLQNMQHLTQLEFRFDWFVGYIDVEVECIDQLGRDVKIHKRIRHDRVMHNLTEYMRIDLKVESYKFSINGRANFRMTHWMSKTYPMSNRVGLVWGFDDRMSHRKAGDIHPAFKNYNDIRNAIIP